MDETDIFHQEGTKPDQKLMAPKCAQCTFKFYCAHKLRTTVIKLHYQITEQYYCADTVHGQWPNVLLDYYCYQCIS